MARGVSGSQANSLNRPNQGVSNLDLTMQPFGGFSYGSPYPTAPDQQAYNPNHKQPDSIRKE